MDGWLVTLLSIGCTLLGGALGVVAALRLVQRDAADEGKSDGVMMTEIGYIKASIDEVKAKLDRQDERYTGICERLAAVEASAKQAHKRLDESGLKR